MDRLPRHTGRVKGFTLIELLVSITLMALILGVLAAGISVIAKGWDKNTAQISQQDMFSRGYSLLRRDIEGMQRVVWHADETPEFLFNGLDDTLQFVVIEPPYPTKPGPYIVSYFIKRTASGAILMRARARYHPDIQKLATVEFKDEVPLLEGPYRFRFSYRDTRSDKRDWLTSWPHKNRLPDLIKLEILEKSTGQPVIVPVIARARIDAEIGCLETKPVLCTTRSGGELAAGKSKKNTTP